MKLQFIYYFINIINKPLYNSFVAKFLAVYIRVLYLTNKYQCRTEEMGAN